MPRLLTESETRDAARIRGYMERLNGVPPEILHRLAVLLNRAPEPATVARHLDRFWRESPNAFLRIAGQVSTLRYLMAVFSYSTFLSEAVVKNPQWLEQLARGDD